MAEYELLKRQESEKLVKKAVPAPVAWNDALWGFVSAPITKLGEVVGGVSHQAQQLVGGAVSGAVNVVSGALSFPAKIISAVTDPVGTITGGITGFLTAPGLLGLPTWVWLAIGAGLLVTFIFLFR